MTTRDWFKSQALLSVARLNEVLCDLTVAEIMECLELESGSRRRRSIINRLIGRAVRINELAYAAKLKKLYL